MTPGTTICCSAFALIALLSAPDATIVEAPFALIPVRTVWTLALNNTVTVAPVYDGARAFFSIEQDRLVAYDLAAGAQMWITEARPILQPTAGGGFVFVAESDGVSALRGSDGSVAWRTSLPDPFAAPPAWSDGWLIGGTSGGRLLALRAADGGIVWERALGAPPGAAPASAADRVYVSAGNGRVLAIDRATGNTIWDRRIGGAPGAILAAEDRLYVGSTDNFFYCLKEKDGSIDWRWRTGGDIVGAPLSDGRRVYFASLDNVLRALDAKSGAQRWMRPLAVRPTAGPVLAGATLAVAGRSPTVKTFAIKDGAPGADISPASGDDVVAPPHVLLEPLTSLPMLVLVTRNIVHGDTVTLVVRSIEPPTTPVAPLPNPVTPVPTPSKTP